MTSQANQGSLSVIAQLLSTTALTSKAKSRQLCPEHHYLKTYGGWRLEGKPGAWEWVAPLHPKSAHFIARARKLAAAKGRARAARQRNFPQRD